MGKLAMSSLLAQALSPPVGALLMQWRSPSAAHGLLARLACLDICPVVVLWLTSRPPSHGVAPWKASIRTSSDRRTESDEHHDRIRRVRILPCYAQLTPIVRQVLPIKGDLVGPERPREEDREEDDEDAATTMAKWNARRCHRSLIARRTLRTNAAPSMMSNQAQTT